MSDAETEARSAFDALLKAAMLFGEAQGTQWYMVRKREASAAKEFYFETLKTLRKAERSAGRLSFANAMDASLVGVPSSMAAPGGMSAPTLYREFLRTISETRAKPI